MEKSKTKQCANPRDYTSTLAFSGFPYFTYFFIFPSLLRVSIITYSFFVFSVVISPFLFYFTHSFLSSSLRLLAWFLLSFSAHFYLLFNGAHEGAR